jgi:Bacterial type II/III secretion system short domain
MNEAKPKRRWFHYSIRELLLLTVIIALAVGWLLDHRQLTKDNSMQKTVYHLRNIDANVAATTLGKMLSPSSDVVIAADVRQNIVIVQSPVQEQYGIRNILSYLDAHPERSE